MNENARSSIAAIVSHNSGGTDDLVSGLAFSLIGRGWRVRGLVQDRFRTNGRYRYALLDLETSTSYAISQNIGQHSDSCLLDLQAMSEASSVLRRVVNEGADLAIINRFGRQEADGYGFSAEMLGIISRGIPLLTIVQAEYLSAWREFTGGVATELPSIREPIEEWLDSVAHNTSIPSLAMEAEESTFKIPSISPGAAMAHGCCSYAANSVSASKTSKPLENHSDNLMTVQPEIYDRKRTIRNGALAKIRRSQGILQQDMAGQLLVSQAHIASLEHKSDMMLSTLRRYINGLGGELDLVAKFPGVSYHLGGGLHQ